MIVIDREIDPACAVEFAPFDVSVGAGRTTVRAAAIDQAALHAIISRVERLGLTLLSVTSNEGEAGEASR